MKAAVFYAKDDIRIEDHPIPQIGSGEILISVKGVGLCGSDIDKILCEAVPPGTVLGHEVVGTIAELGDGVDGYAIGDRVVVAHHVSCGKCHYCLRGSDSKCDLFRSTNLHPGGFAEFLRVPAPNVHSALFAVPDDIPNEEIVFMEPLACCVRAVDRSQLLDGDVILIVGAGSIGLLFTQLLKLHNTTVLMSDLLQNRLDIAVTYGADKKINPTKDNLEKVVQECTEGRGVDLVMITVASQGILDQAISVVRDGGLINFFAGKRGGLELTLDINEIYEREIAIISTYSSSPATLRKAFDAIVQGKIRTEGLITHRLPLSGILEGVNMMVNNEALKVFIAI